MASSETLETISFENARRLVEKHASGLHSRGRELTELLSSIGLVLAEPILADRDFPPYPRAARDGYAIQAADVETLPATLRVVGEVRAGAPPVPSFRVGSGEAASIMTGAAAPPGADCVVMVEHTRRNDDCVEITKAVSAAENIAATGTEAKRGETLLSSGAKMDEAALAIAASVGRAHLLVYSKPRIAVLATGDEVVDVSAQPGPTQIRNSNSYSLAAQIQDAGGVPVLLPIAPDNSERLKELICEGLEADLLLISGGVSVGRYDLVETALGELGAEFFFSSVQIQPGRPVVFGKARHKYFLGLPGNPVSTMVTFELFARPLLDALCGMTPSKLIFLYARLKSDIKTKTGLKRFLPGRLSGEFDYPEVERVPWHGSGDIAAMASANCYLVIPPDRDVVTAGEWIPILMR